MLFVRLAYSQVFSSIFIKRAIDAPNDIEKLKWITVFHINKMSLNAIQTKPFNPIIGETCQLNVDDLNIYAEQISNKPPISLLLCISPQYKIQGSQIVEAKTGANSVKATTSGKIEILLSGDYRYEIQDAQIILKGITVGKRTFNYRRCSVIIDHVRSFY